MSDRPIDLEEFTRCLSAFALFERAPHLAVAVSGGADSLALLLLAARWATANGGSVSALTVDHGLRPESADEARAVRALCRRFAIPHETLVWRGEKPVTGLQAAAREARYRLLDSWCRDAGVLHLLVAHHADDQAETVLLRMEKGSGPDGLAAMSPVRELPNCRLLRPLLDFPKTRLIATVQAAGESWIEDPSNRNEAFARVRMRNAIEAASIDSVGLTSGANRMRRARTALEAEMAAWLGRHASVSPYGLMTMDLDALLQTDPEIRIRVLSRASASIGGKAFPPAVDAVERLEQRLPTRQSATLGGVLFKPDHGALRVFREARNLPEPMVLPVASFLWDGRFQITADRGAPKFVIAPLGQARLRRWPVRERPDWMTGIRTEALACLPVLTGPKTEMTVPQPGKYEKNGVMVRFQPKKPLSGSGFAIA